MTVRIACVLVVALAVIPASTQAAAHQPPPKPGALWRQYPLGTQRLTGTTPTTTTTTTTTVPAGAGRQPAPPRTNASRSRGLLASAFLFGAIALLLAAAAIVALRLSRRAGRPAEQITTSLVTIERAAARLESRRQAREIEEQRPEWDNFTPTRKRGTVMTDQLNEGVETSTTQVEEARQSYAELGDRVAGVIKAAEDVAAQIRSDAVEEASMIKQQAEDAAVKAIREAAKERDELRASSEAYAAEIRVTGEKYATERRREGEAESAKLIAEGEAQARALREAAEEMGLRIETNALQRRDELEEHSRAVEAKLRRFQAGLSSISEDVHGLLEPRTAEGATLAEALGVDGRRAATQPPAGQRQD